MQGRLFQERRQEPILRYVIQVRPLVTSFSEISFYAYFYFLLKLGVSHVFLKQQKCFHLSKRKTKKNLKMLLINRTNVIKLQYYCYYFYQLLTTQLFSINLFFSNHFPCHPIKMSTPVNNLCVLGEKYSIQSHWDYISLVERTICIMYIQINK